MSVTTIRIPTRIASFAQVREALQGRNVNIHADSMTITVEVNNGELLLVANILDTNGLLANG